MFERMLQKTCTIIHREEDEDTVDRYGNPEIDQTETQTVCEIQQRRTEEPELSGEMAATQWNAWFPEDTELDTTDQVLVDDQTYEVVGEPERGTGISNRWGFLEAILERTGKVPSA